jgi:hypothetical protein
MLSPKDKIELLQQIRDLIMDGSQVPRLKGGMPEGEVSEENIEIPTPEAMMGSMEEAPEMEEDKDDDEDVKGVMLSMSRLAASKPANKAELKKKGKKVK